MVKTKVGCIIAPRKISFVEKDLKINDGQVLVKIYKAYLCGSELHYYRGEYPLEKLDEAFNRYDKDPNVIKLAVKP